MKYERYQYIYPPRPENAVPISRLDYWDNDTMIAQPKLNGSNCSIFMNGIDQPKIMNRKRQVLTNMKMNSVEFSSIYNLERGQWMVLNGEYLNKSKTDEKGQIFNHKFCIFDILVYNSEHLIGKTFEYRINLIDDIFPHEECGKDYLSQITENIYHIKSYNTGFVNLYNRLSRVDVIEGLILKRKNARLESGISESNNFKSQIKFRKSTKNYQF